MLNDYYSSIRFSKDKQSYLFYFKTNNLAKKYLIKETKKTVLERNGSNYKLVDCKIVDNPPGLLGSICSIRFTFETE